MVLDKEGEFLITLVEEAFTLMVKTHVKVQVEDIVLEMIQLEVKEIMAMEDLEVVVEAVMNMVLEEEVIQVELEMME